PLFFAAWYLLCLQAICQKGLLLAVCAGGPTFMFAITLGANWIALAHLALNRRGLSRRRVMLWGSVLAAGAFVPLPYVAAGYLATNMKWLHRKVRWLLLATMPLTIVSLEPSLFGWMGKGLECFEFVIRLIYLQG